MVYPPVCLIEYFLIFIFKQRQAALPETAGNSHAMGLKQLRINAGHPCMDDKCAGACHRAAGGMATALVSAVKVALQAKMAQRKTIDWV